MPRPRRRRLLRISLRTVFVILTLLCAILALKVRQAERQKAVIAWVEAHGGNCYYNYEWDGIGLLFNAELPGPDWLCLLVGADYFASVAQVTLTGGDIKDLSPLYELKELKTLILWRPVQVPDVEVARFARKLPECEIWYLPRVVERTVENVGEQ